MSLSPGQLAQRIEGISATDVAAIVGCHPYRRPVDVWLEKTGRAKAFQESRRSRWGERIEPLVRDEYEELHNVRVEVPGTLAHPRRVWELATPDGIVYPLFGGDAENGLEIKVHGRDAVWFGGLVYGTPGTDEVPPHELVQCAWGMEVTGLARWDLVAFLDGAPQEYRIERDEELLDLLREASERFLIDHVRGDREPPPDGSKSWDRWLRRRWPEHSEDMVAIDTMPELRTKIEDLREARERLADAEQLAERLTQELKVEIGDKAGLTWREFGRPKPSKVTWKFSKEQKVTDWECIANEMRGTAALGVDARQVAIALSMIDTAVAAHEGHDPEFHAAAELARARVEAMLAILEQLACSDIVEAHTKTYPGPRPFYVPRHWKKPKTEEKKNNQNEER